MKKNVFEAFFNALGDVCDEMERERKEREEREAKEKAKLDEEFAAVSKENSFTRGTVVATMAESGWSSYDMRWVLDKVTTPERAEAAVGLVKAGYDWFHVCNILDEI